MIQLRAEKGEGTAAPTQDPPEELTLIDTPGEEDKQTPAQPRSPQPLPSLPRIEEEEENTN